LLADIYISSDLAYVGGGFGPGVHSVIEPAVYANAICFGPNFHILDMAVNLADLRLAAIIHSGEDFLHFLSLFDNNNRLRVIQIAMKEFIDKQKLASNAIINAIFSHA